MKYLKHQMMDYRAELQILLDDETLSFEEWLRRYPIQECPRLIQEYKIFMQKFLIEEGDFEAVEELQELDELADNIENYAIDKLAEKQEKDIELLEMVRKFEALKELLIKNDSQDVSVKYEIVNEMLKFVDILKKHGLYDETVWKPLLPKS